MTTLGNIFLVIAIIFYLIFAFLILTNQAGRPGSGDAGVEYSYIAGFFNLAFSFCVIIITIAISRQGGFHWVSSGASVRNIVIIFSLLAVLVSCVIGSVLNRTVAIVFPLVLLALSAVMLNESLQLNMPVKAWKIPLMLVVGISALSCAGMLVYYIADQQIKTVKEAKETQDTAVELNNQELENIKNTDVLTSLVFLLSYTNQYQNSDLRKASLAKIKTNPNWQQELIRLLKSGWASEVFVFLADNEVEDKKLFAEPVNTGIINVAEHVQSNKEGLLYNDSYNGETQNILATVEKFKDSGIDYTPAIKKLRIVFDKIQSDDGSVKFDCIPMLDEWIKAHS